MSPRIPLPENLGDRAFLVADARGCGLSASRLRGPDLTRPHHGVRASGVPDAIRDYLPLLRPGDRFSHGTAALLWPVPLPPRPPGLHVTATAPLNPPRRPGVVGHVNDVDHSVLRNGLRVSDPVTMFLELATVLGHDELVAVGDALVLDPAILDPHDVRPWVSLDELRTGCLASRGRGCRRARAALDDVRVGAESPMETSLRLLLVRAGLPEPLLNVPVSDHRGEIGRFDMVYRDQRVIVEYDGDQHRRSVRQYEKDMTRIDRAIAAGWVVVRVRAHGMFRTPEHTVARVRQALARGIELP